MTLRFEHVNDATGRLDAMRVVEKYYRSERAESRSDVGLGLCSANDVVEMQAGNLWLHIFGPDDVALELQVPS